MLLFRYEELQYSLSLYGWGVRVESDEELYNFIFFYILIFASCNTTMYCWFPFFSKNKFISKKRMLKCTVKLQVILQNYNQNRFFFFFFSFGLYLVKHGKHGFHIIDGPLYCYIISSVYVTHFIS